MEILPATVQPDLIFAAARFTDLLAEAGITAGSDEYRLFLPALAADWADGAAAARVDATLPLLLPPGIDSAVMQQALNISRLVSQVTLLFEQLRRVADLPLGVADYQLMLRALQRGHGRNTPQDPHALRRLCHLVWANSPIEQAIINAYFDRTVTTSTLAAPPDAPPPTDTAVPTAEPDEETPPPQPKPKLSEPTPPPLQGEAARPSTPARRKLPPVPATSPGDLLLDATPALLVQTEDREVALQQYLLVNEYLPVTRRQMKQSWRYLRRPRREGPPVELDIEATIAKISQDGFFLTPALRPRRVNKAGLLLLIDQEGSMAPFHVLARRLQETAVEAGKLGRTDIYYFHDCPPPLRGAPLPTAANPYRQHQLYRHEQLRAARPATEIVADFYGLETSALIFSDAGAARGDWDETRIEHTALFLYQLKTLGIEHIAWVNPMPEERWANTSAAAIARMLDMFSLDRHGLYQAIDVLRGRARRPFVL